MTPSKPRDRTRNGRVRKAWRLPAALVEFLRTEADAYDLDVTHLVIRIFSAFDSYFALGPGPVADLERDRGALEMGRWDYLSHALERRAHAVREGGPGFDAPGAGPTGRLPEATRVHLERHESGGTLLQNWHLPPALLKALRREAERQQLSQTAMAVSVLNLYAGFFPLPQAGAATLERDRAALGLGRLDYLRHLLWRRAEAVEKEGPGFDVPRGRGRPG